MKRFFGILLFSMILADALPTEAGLTISIPGQSLAPGSSLFSFVTVSGSISELNSITALNLVFDITPDNSNMLTPVASLQFVAPSDAAHDPTLNDISYLFYGQSADTDFPAVPFGSVSSPPGSGGYFTQFNGNDSSDGTPITLNKTVYDLAVLQITYNASQTTNSGGDLFDIRLNPSSTYDTAIATGLSFANDPGTNQPPQGQVFVTANTAVPEPSSLQLGLIALLAFIVCRLSSNLRTSMGS